MSPQIVHGYYESIKGPLNLKIYKRRTGRMRTRTVNLFDRTSSESGFFSVQLTTPQGCQRLELGCCSETAPRNAS